MADLTFADVITFARNSPVNGWTEGPVLTGFANDAPAFVIDPATGQSLGYRSLAGFTNLSLRSSAFDQSPWSTFNASIAANVSGVTAPDGTETVDRLDSESDSGNRLVQQDITVSESTTYTLSVFAKAADIDTFLLRENQNDGIQASFDLTDGTANLGLGDSADIESVGNGWFRCMVTGTTEAGQTNYRAEVRLGGSSLTDSIYVWGAQLVEGVIAGPPIETEGTPVSTAADAATEPVGDWFNPDEGTFVIEWMIENPGSENRTVFGGDNNDFQLQYRGGDLRVYARGSANSYADSSINLDTVVGGVKQKVAWSWDAEGATVAHNGATQALPSAASDIGVTEFIYGNGEFDNPLNGYIQSVKYFPDRLSAADLQAATS